MPVRSSPLDRVNQQWEEGGLCDVTLRTQIEGEARWL